MNNHTPAWGGGRNIGKDTLRVLARRAAAPVLDRLWPRVETIAARSSAALATELRSEIADLRSDMKIELAELRTAIDATIGDLAGRVDWTENELRRIGPHVAAVDERVAGLERPAPDPTADAPAQGEARSLVEEIRGEHARVRARLSAVAHYEHRIAKMEQALTTLAGNTN
jgi:hypothetical protein